MGQPMDNTLLNTVDEAQKLRANLEHRILGASWYRGPYFEEHRRQEVKALTREIHALDQWLAEHTQHAPALVAQTQCPSSARARRSQEQSAND